MIKYVELDIALPISNVSMVLMQPHVDLDFVSEPYRCSPALKTRSGLINTGAAG